MRRGVSAALAFSLLFDNNSDVALSASPVQRVARFSKVPMFGGKWLEFSANMAGFPPHTVSQLAPAMQTLVSCGVNKGKVFKPVILLVSVSVVDRESFWDRPVCLFPNPVMGQHKSGRFCLWVPDGESVVPLSGSVPDSARML